MDESLINYLLNYHSNFLNKEEAIHLNFFSQYYKKSYKSKEVDFGWIPERKTSKEIYIKNYQQNLADFIAQKRLEISQIDFLLDIGHEEYRKNVAKRIWAEHKSEIVLNLCPKCNSLARTPLAKQCKCGHSWR